MVRFYFAAETSDLIKSFAKPERVKQDTDENFDQTEKYIGVTISKEIYEEVKIRTNAFFKTNQAIFIRELHRSNSRLSWRPSPGTHLLGEEISIFDCIELMRGSAIQMWLPTSDFWRWTLITTAGRISANI